MNRLPEIDATAGGSAVPEPTAETVVAVWSEDPFLCGRIRTILAADDMAVQSSDVSPDVLTSRSGGEAPRIVVVAAKRPNAQVIADVRLLRAELGEVGIVLLSERVAPGDVRKALDAGADGVLATAHIQQGLGVTVRAVLAGQVVVPQDSREYVLKPVLTVREKQILGLVVMGMTNCEIATKLFLAESTVKSHLSAGFAKLGVSSRNEAVALILDPERGRGLGILTIPSEPLPGPV